MTWLRIDDGMVDHRKWAALEEDPRAWSECLAVWLALASYCARVSSDGFVEDARIGRLTPLGAKARQRCDDLVRVGLMEREPGGYRFHDWLDYQPSAADVTRDREAARLRQRRARDEARSRRESRDLSRRDMSRDSESDSRSTSTVSHAPPVPSRPVPSSLSTRGGDARAPVREVPPMAEARAHLDAFEARCEAVRVAVDRECRAVRRSPPPPACNSMSPEVTGVARWLSTAGEVDVDAMVRRWAHARDRKGGWAPLRWLANDPTEYAFPAPSESAVRLTSEQEEASIEDFISAGTRRAEAL